MTFVYGLLQPTVTPVVKLSKPSGEIQVADVLITLVSLIGVLALLAIVIGLATGGVFILFRRWRDGQATESPLASYTRLGLSAADREAAPSGSAGSAFPATPTATPHS